MASTTLSDELAEINGIKPKTVMVDGDEREVSSLSRYEPHQVKMEPLIFTLSYLVTLYIRYNLIRFMVVDFCSTSPIPIGQANMGPLLLVREPSTNI